MLGSANYFLGFKAFTDSTWLYLTQSKYIIDLLKKTNILDAKPYNSFTASGVKLSLHEGEIFADPTCYRSTIGALQYLTYTRLDISYIVNKLSQFFIAPTTLHWQACKRVLRYLSGTVHKKLWFKPSSGSLKLEAYSDADWASSVDDRWSISGHYVFLVGNLISWSSQKQIVVARSSAEAEYRFMAQLTSEVL
ncbi:hypothetical protein ACOSP7_023965 [Xanthoceras sorbifolium]